ncbi:ATP-binding cassette domain-containing protein, partial [Sphaerisporangium flaviroseum]
PTGTLPAGTVPTGTLPAGTVPTETVPAGAILTGTVPAGTASAGTAPEQGTRPTPPAPSPEPTAAPATGYALEARDLTVRDGDGVARLSGVSFGVRPGEIVGVAGVAGSGQREMVDAVTGLRVADSGAVHLLGTGLAGATVRRRRDLGIAYVPEDRHGRATAASMSVAENLIMGDQRHADLRGRLGRLAPAVVEERARALTERFSVRTASVRTPISALSGGNAQKTVLARELSRRTPVIVVEEPTQGVDVGAQEYIHSLLIEARDRGQAVLLVSSELSELRALADRVLVVYAGRVVAEFPRERATEEALGAAMTGSPPTVTDPPPTMTGSTAAMTGSPPAAPAPEGGTASGGATDERDDRADGDAP